MLTAILAFLSGIGGWIIAALAAAGTVFALMAKSKHDARREADAINNAANAQQALRDLEASVARQQETTGKVNEVQAEVNQMPPDDVDAQLRRDWSRPERKE